MADQTVYLDHAAATPLDAEVLKVMQPYWQEKFANPSATYSAAREVKQALADARAAVAHWLGARPAEVVFTAGGTEANNLAVHGVMREFPDGNVVVSAIEHESVLMPARHYENRETAVGADGRIDLKDLENKIDDRTVLVSVMYANNEIGTIQPIREVARLVESVRRRRNGGGLPLYLHTDACQAANYLDLHAARLGVDLLTINGGKIYGPKQAGALYVKAGARILPLIDGGGQERGLRSGTENVASIIGLAAALDKAQTIRHQEAKRLQGLQQQFFKELEKAAPAMSINGSLKHRLPNNVHITMPGQDNERLIIELDERGIAAAAGSACSASNEEPSHVLRAIGLDDEAARASLRLTLGRSTTNKDIERCLNALQDILP